MVYELSPTRLQLWPLSLVPTLILSIAPTLTSLRIVFLCSTVKLLGMNFEIQLEVLNLSYTSVGNEDLYVISKRCRRLLQLSMQNCKNITIEGVIHVVKNCPQLGEINLHHCHKVNANAVVSMVRLRPSFLSEPWNVSFFFFEIYYFEKLLTCLSYCWDLTSLEIKIFFMLRFNLLRN